MSRRKVDTTINDIIKIAVQTIGDSPQQTSKLIDALASTIPIKKAKQKKADPYLNKTLKLRRYNGELTINVISLDNCLPNCYIARVISVDSGTTHLKVSDTLTISKRELEVTSRKVY